MNSKVNSRIKQAPAFKVIDLEDHEDDIYNGAGWRLARFVDGKLAELFNPLDHAYERDALSETATEALAASIRWANEAKGEIWMVMCSCRQLCEPEPLLQTDALGWAKFARKVGDELTDMDEMYTDETGITPTI